MNPSRLNKQIWVEKPRSGSPVTCGKTPTLESENAHSKIRESLESEKIIIGSLESKKIGYPE